MTAPNEEVTTSRVGPGEVIRSRSVWVLPLIGGSVLVMLMTLIYFGSIVDPGSHLRGLPVSVVDNDQGASTATGKVNVGQQVVAGLTGSPAVSHRLAVHVTTLAGAEARMDNGADYAALVIPAGFTDSVLALGGASSVAGQTSALPTIQLLTNGRAGSLGVSLASSVFEPAVASISQQVGHQVLASSEPSSSAALQALRTDPITVAVVAYRPLPSHSGLGLSAFYIALLVMMCGFLGATIVNTSVDVYLGYATSEVGPWWRQRLPRPITRWHTLLAKWVVALGTIPVLTGLLLVMAAGILRMDAAHLWYLWLFATFAAIVIAIGTLVFFAALDRLGNCWLC